MKIIIVAFFLTVQAQSNDDQTSTFNSNSNLLTTNDWNLITEKAKTVSVELFSNNIDEYLSTNLNENKINNSTILNDFVSTIISGEFQSTYQSETWSTGSDQDYSSLSTQINIDSTIFPDERQFVGEEWLNVNESNKKGDRSIFWKKVNDPSWNGTNYIIRSQGECLRDMCSIKLKYNGKLSTNLSGCLSFTLWIRGDPVGQLWIEEDKEEENFSQKIQLTNNTLRVEHSLKSKIKNLSINARILFRNSKIDAITLFNLNVNWKGPCPKHRSVVTPFQHIHFDQSTLENDLTRLSTEEDSYLSSTLKTNNLFETSENESFVETSTIKFEIIKKSFSFINQLKYLLIIFIFCLFIILSSFIYGLWSIQKHYRFIWYVNFDYPIQFIARRSVRSSTRSNYKISTLSQITAELFPEEYFDNSITNSNRSKPSAYLTYF